MKNSISKSDFQFTPVASGSYKVTYTSPKTFKSWSAIVNHMPLIDATANECDPTTADLNELKRICKL